MFRPWRKHRLPDKRTVLIPNQWNGSVQQYFHFLLGYLAPIVRWSRAHPGQQIAVRDCGPMNRWFDLLRPEIDVEVMTVGDVLHVLAGDLQPNRVLRGMDFPDEFSSHELADFATWTREIALERASPPLGSTSIVISDRASSDEFFATSAAEWPESGSQKRSVPNLGQVVASLDAQDVRVLDAAQVDIYEQILIHTHARILVGQHGAGLTNMIWMPKGSWVIEILPPMPDDAQPIFRNLASAMGHQHLVVEQESVHAPVNADQLLRAIAQASESH